MFPLTRCFRPFNRGSSCCATVKPDAKSPRCHTSSCERTRVFQCLTSASFISPIELKGRGRMLRTRWSPKWVSLVKNKVTFGPCRYLRYTAFHGFMEQTIGLTPEAIERGKHA